MDTSASQGDGSPPLRRIDDNSAEVTIKPADKNLGIVIMNTDNYLQICASQLADTNTYTQS